MYVIFDFPALSLTLLVSPELVPVLLQEAALDPASQVTVNVAALRTHLHSFVNNRPLKFLIDMLIIPYYF